MRRENLAKQRAFSTTLLKRLSPYFLLIFICIGLFLPGISSLPIMDRDESHFVQATRQMMESGNYFSTQYLTITRHQKSPGINWFQAASVEIFSTAKSNSIWSYRLPSFLGALASVLLLFYFTKEIFDEKTAFLASILLSSSLLLILEAHIAVIDACLIATVIAMQGALWKIYADPSNCPPRNDVFHRSGNCAAIIRNPEININTGSRMINRAVSGMTGLSCIFWFSLSLGFLLKGSTLLIAFLTITTLFIFDRNILWIKSLRPFVGLAFFIFTTFLWVIPASFANHGNYLLQLFQHDLLPKLTHGAELHGEPPGYYLLIFSFVFFPGSLFVCFAIFWAWKNRHEKVERFLMAWIIPTWIFFALMPTKLPQYLLPLFPPIAVLTARGILNMAWPVSRFFRIFQYFQLIFWSTIGLGIALFPLFLARMLHNDIPKTTFISSSILFLSLLIAISFFCQQKYRACLFSSILGLGANLAILSIWILPALSNFWLSQKIMDNIHTHAQDLISEKYPLITIDYQEPSLAFYLGTKKIAVGSQINSKNVFLISKEKLETIEKHQHLPIKIISSSTAYNYSVGKWETYYLLNSPLPLWERGPRYQAMCPKIPSNSSTEL